MKILRKYYHHHLYPKVNHQYGKRTQKIFTREMLLNMQSNLGINIQEFEEILEKTKDRIEMVLVKRRNSCNTEYRLYTMIYKRKYSHGSTIGLFKFSASTISRNINHLIHFKDIFTLVIKECIA